MLVNGNMANLIPMAGIGKRFSKEGYKLPKPLISVSGMPMVVKAIKDMPPSDKWIFVVRKEHIDGYQVDQVIRSEIPEAIIIPVEKTTEGQACTCMLAESYLNPDEPLFIASCDNGFLFNEKEYELLKKDADCVVWTFTQRETLRRNPTAWGWCKLADDGKTIVDMSIKVPISKNPYNDHAVVASFYFKKAKDFFNAVDLMIKEKYRIKNEFYVDAVPIFLKKMNKKSVIFDVDLYVGWGTPSDLHDYQFLEFVCKYENSKKSLNPEDVELLHLWAEYFKK